MAGGLVALFDDIAALAKMAAATLDDAAAAAGRASSKTIGVVVDDAAVTPGYVAGLAADRELPIIKKIAIGSIRNKMIIILPVAMLLSSFDFGHTLIEVILIVAGSYLAFEGAHKVIHKLKGHDPAKDHAPAVAAGPEAEKTVISGAVRTDLILSAEIMVIALKDTLNEPSWFTRLLVMIIVAFVITAVVYGAVALIVKMDDIGLRMVERNRSEASVKFGRGLVNAMPKVMSGLTLVGTVAMLWVGGHIVTASIAELGFSAPYDLIHDIAEPFGDVSGIGGFLGWFVNTACSALVGLIWGGIIATIVDAISARRKGADGAAAAAH